jgi:hypothetical protein
MAIPSPGQSMSAASFFHAGPASIAFIRQSGFFARQAAWRLANMLIRIKRELENSLFP